MFHQFPHLPCFMISKSREDEIDYISMFEILISIFFFIFPTSAYTESYTDKCICTECMYN